MVKKAILLLSAAAGLGNAAYAQVCATDEVHREFIKNNPKVAEIQRAMDMEWRGAAYKTTAVENYEQYLDSVYNNEISQKLIVPVVVHVIHDYGTENVSDNEIYTMMNNLNSVYSAKNSDLSSVIAPFKKYIGNANIEFRLAQKDPSGNPTSGITRHLSALTKGGDDQAKMDQWPPNRYLNIWLENVIGRGADGGGIVLAYATLPAGAAQYPYSDGVIAAAAYINDATKTIAHEVGHYLNLYHPWNNNQQPVASAVCGDDEVDDTPPTPGHFSTCPLYDTVCGTGYYKEYTFLKNGLPVTDTIDYPDTVNVQNIMDYSSCTNMFTKQQVLRMREALKSPVASRNGLIDPITYIATGVLEPRADLAPVADFSVEKPSLSSERGYYMCANIGKDFVFKNQSWRDTVTSVEWSFSNGGYITSSNNPITGNTAVKFTEPGWATITLAATGNNSGTGTVSRQAVYVADPNDKINPLNGNMQDFSGDDAKKWPSFNYYNNQTAWEISNVTGYYDNYSIVYKGYDTRLFPSNLVGSYKGDYDDFFTPAFDLSGMTTGDCNLNFMSSGVFRTTNADLMNDVLEVAYSIDCGGSWVRMDSLKKARLANKGSYGNPYAPLWLGDWVLQSMNIPTAARTERTFFRFRYKPSVDQSGNPSVHRASGNNFYIDRINVSNFPLGVNTLVNGENTVTLAPNPTTNSSFVVISGSDSKNAEVVVTDITGKVVYRVQEQLGNNITRIEIPASAISVKGVYMVQVVTGAQKRTEKLVVY